MDDKACDASQESQNLPQALEAEDSVIDDAEILESEGDLEPAAVLEAAADDDVVAAQDSVSPPKLQHAETVGMMGEITAEDEAFIRRVFQQVRDIDWRGVPPPPSRAAAGMDKKMAVLRDQVRKLEREMARVGYIWAVKWAQVEKVDAILAGKEAERQTATARYEQIKAQGTRAAQAHKRELEVVARRIQDLEAQVAQWQDKLRALDSQKQQELGVAAQALAEAQSEIAVLTSDFRLQKETLEAETKAACDKFTNEEAHLKERLSDRDALVAQLNQDLDDFKARISKKDAAIEQIEAAFASAQAEGAGFREAWEAEQNSRTQAQGESKELRARAQDLEKKIADLDTKLEAREQTLETLAKQLAEKAAKTAESGPDEQADPEEKTPSLETTSEAEA